MSLLANCLKGRVRTWSLELCYWNHGHLEKLRQPSMKINYANKLKLPCAAHIFTYTRHAGLKLGLNSRSFSSTCGVFKSNRHTTGHTNATEEDDDEGDEDAIGDGEVDELFQEFVPTAILDGDHRVFIVHPDVKWGSKKQHLTTGEQK